MRLLRRDAYLAASSLPLDVQQRCRVSSFLPLHVSLGPDAQRAVEDYCSSLPAVFGTALPALRTSRRDQPRTRLRRPRQLQRRDARRVQRRPRPAPTSPPRHPAASATSSAPAVAFYAAVFLTFLASRLFQWEPAFVSSSPVGEPFFPPRVLGPLGGGGRGSPDLSCAPFPFPFSPTGSLSPETP